MPVREERQHSNDKDGRYPPSPNAVQNMPFAWAAFSDRRSPAGRPNAPFVVFLSVGVCFSPSENPNIAGGSDGARWNRDVHKGFWRSSTELISYARPSLGLGIINYQNSRIHEPSASVPLVGRNRFRRYLRCRSYCSATRRRSFQHPKVGNENSPTTGKSYKLRLRIEQYVGTGTPVAEKSN